MKKIKSVCLDSETFGSLLEDFYAEKQLKGITAHTLKDYHYFLSILPKDEEATEELVNSTILEIQASKSWSASTKNCYLRHLKSFLRHCNSKGYSFTLPTIRSITTVKKVYSDADLEALTSKPKEFKEFTDYRNWLIVMTFIDTGMRSGSLRNIRIEDVDLSCGTISLSHTKQKRSQTIYISSALVKALKGFLLRYRGCSEWLFPDQYGRQLSENALRIAIRNYNKSRGVEITSCHAFRHAFARNYLLKCGGDAFRLQRHLGHSTLAVTKEYCQLFDKDLANDLTPLEMICKQKIKSI